MSDILLTGSTRSLLIAGNLIATVELPVVGALLVLVQHRPDASFSRLVHAARPVSNEREENKDTLFLRPISNFRRGLPNLGVVS